MQLFENQLFDGRYLLVELIGRGASAEVWKAVDTKAGNMPVAVKIYKPDTLGPGSAGIAEFQREFTMVYNMTHTNLLHPQGFDIFEGSPYLVMAFCENGSATSMVGRADEEDVLRFLRDVAAGLEYLHDHNITHQDIKPDNVLVDENCNFMVTDFGISRRESANDAIGGTRAYMAPEVYKRSPEHASDIWSLGATAVELLDGQPPYGELGGAGQLQNPAMPTIRAKVSAPVKKLITDMLNPDPRKRPSASAIRTAIDHFRETGSWNRNVQRNKIAYISAGIAALLLCVGLFFWDINRTKVRYYKDYTEIWGVPEGIGRVSAFDQKHREMTYKMEYQRGKLRHITRVNQFGNLVVPNETEFENKLIEAEYFYSNEGKVDYVKVYNQGGECTYVMDFDANLLTLIFKSNDQHGTEKPIKGKTTETSLALQGSEPSASAITRYKLTYDDKGRIARQEYATFQNVDVTDDDMIHGIEFQYDDRNRIIRRTSIGLDGKPRGNKRGLAIKEYAFDDDDNWISLKYLTVDGKPSDDGSFVPVLTHEYDKYGNVMSERYFNLEGKPMIRPDINAASCIYERDDIGQLIKQSLLDIDGNPSYTKSGFARLAFEYDDNGYKIKTSYLDANDSLVNANIEDVGVVSIVTATCNPRGLELSYRMFDRHNNPVESNFGVHKFEFTYDSVGHLTGRKTFDKAIKPVNVGGFTASESYTYNALGQNTSISYFDSEGHLANGTNGFARQDMEYSLAGHLTKMSFFDADGKPVLVKNRFASFSNDYDQRGNQIATSYFDTAGKPIDCIEGWHKAEYTFDPATNYQTGIKYFKADNSLLSQKVMKYDGKGNIVEQRTLDRNGNLKNGSAIEHFEYDSNNRVTKYWHTNASGSRINEPGKTYCEARIKYDRYGNEAERSYWSVSGQAAVDADDVHRAVKEYNNLNQLVKWCNYDTTGNPTKMSSTSVPEMRYEYDNRGNLTVYAIFDGKGNPALHPQGYHKQLHKYDEQNRVIEESYVDKDGKLVDNSNFGGAKISVEYDAHGNMLKNELFDKNGKLVLVAAYKYNAHDKIIEQTFKDSTGKTPSDKFSKIVWEYEPDGLMPKKQTYYDHTGKLLAWLLWDKEKGEWDETPHFSGESSGSAAVSAPVASSGSGWQEEFRAFARQCPMTVDENVDIQSVSVGSNSVTITYKLKQVSKYEMDADSRAAVRQVMNGMRGMFGDALPSYVSLKVVLLDKAGRTIDV